MFLVFCQRSGPRTLNIECNLQPGLSNWLWPLFGGKKWQPNSNMIQCSSVASGGIKSSEEGERVSLAEPGLFRAAGWGFRELVPLQGSSKSHKRLPESHLL